MLKQADLSSTLGVIEAGREKGLHLGAQVYLSRKGEVLFNQGIGEARPGVPMRADTMTLWMSSCKPLTATAVAQLWEQGQLALDEPVGTFLPPFAAQGKDGITVRHLLQHTGGFRAADIGLGLQSWDEAIEHICKAPLEPRWVPGRKAGYHAACSWYILGELVRLVDGRSIDQVIYEELMMPLGQTEARLGLPHAVQEAAIESIADMQYTRAKSGQSESLFNSPEGRALVRPGGNGRGPASSLGAFYESLLGFGSIQLIKPETISAFVCRSRVDMFDETFKTVMDWGLGFMPDNNRHGPVVPYGYGRFCSEDTFGHSGALSSTAFADPEAGLVVVVMFNGMPGELLHQKRIRHVCEAIYTDLDLAG